MRVFVSIQVRGLNAGIQDFPHLPRELVVNFDAAERDCGHQSRNCRGITFCSHQHQMDTDVQPWILAR